MSDKTKKELLKPLTTGDRTIPPEGARMIPIYIMGREYVVPETLTIMKAVEYAGYTYVRVQGRHLRGLRHLLPLHRGLQAQDRARLPDRGRAQHDHNAAALLPL